MIDEKALEAAATAICLSDGLNINEFLGGERASIFRHATKHARAAILAYESAKQKGEAEGWVLVPREPTHAQKLAGSYITGSYDVAHECYRRMLSAGGEG